MDSKKESAGQGKVSYLSISNVRNFFMDVRAEFLKIVWPEKRVTIGMTSFVILLVVIISLYLGSIDLLIGKLVYAVLH